MIGWEYIFTMILIGESMKHGRVGGVAQQLIKCPRHIFLYRNDPSFQKARTINTYKYRPSSFKTYFINFMFQKCSEKEKHEAWFGHFLSCLCRGCFVSVSNCKWTSHYFSEFCLIMIAFIICLLLISRNTYIAWNSNTKYSCHHC